MADTGKSDDGTDDRSSLEMPSFSLRRRKKAPAEGSTVPPAPEPPQDLEQPTAVVPALEPEAVEDQPVHREPRPRRQLPTIALSGLPAAAATGVVVGALAVLLSWLATRACDVVRGTPACGGGPGLLVLLVVLVALAYAGSVLLRIFDVPDAGSTSVLAVGILAVLVLVFLLGSIDEWWMVIAIPVAAVIAFCASWSVTNAVSGDDAEVDASEPHDVR